MTFLAASRGTQHIVLSYSVVRELAQMIRKDGESPMPNLFLSIFRNETKIVFVLGRDRDFLLPSINWLRYIFQAGSIPRPSVELHPFELLLALCSTACQMCLHTYGKSRLDPFPGNIDRNRNSVRTKPSFKQAGQYPYSLCLYVYS